MSEKQSSPIVLIYSTILAILIGLTLYCIFGMK